MEIFNNISNESKTAKSNVVNFYTNRNVLITGGTGFLGKVLIEKLLRSCTNLSNIYILMRAKRNKKPEERFQELFDEPVFELVRHDKNLLQKVRLVEGNITEKNLGIGEENLMKIIKEVSVVFHVAATIKFDEPLKLAININVIGTKNVIGLCRKIQQLAALVHVSTAYANCDKGQIDEHIYPVNMDPEKLIEIANCFDQDTLQELKSRLLATRPNTYTYTKALAEWLLVRQARDLPVVVCRPSIVTASWKDPFAGWIDNIHGPTGVILGTGKGLIRSMFAEPDCVADLVPVDIVTNLMILLAWFAFSYQNQKQLSNVMGRFSESATESDSVSDRDSLEEYSYDPNPTAHLQINNGASNNNGNNLECELNGPRTVRTIGRDILRSYEMDRRSNESNSSLSQRRDTQLSPALSFDDGYGGTSQPSDNKPMTTPENSIQDKPKVQKPQTTQPPVSIGDFVVDDKLKQIRANVQTKLAAKKLAEEIADVPVFHCTSGGENPITWGNVQVIIVPLLAQYPSIKIYRYPSASFTNNRRLDKFFRVTLHYAPAYLLDFFSHLFGDNLQLVRLYKKIDQASTLLRPFTTKQWKFNSENHQILLNEIMSEEDKKLFDYDIKSLDWSDYFSNYVLGVKRFIIKEPMSDLAEARRNLSIVYYRNLLLQICSILSLVGLIYYVQPRFII